MDHVELWIQTTTLLQRRPCSFCKISLICKCLSCYINQKRESTFPQMWLSTFRAMWYSLFSHSEDHRSSWSHYDKNTTLEGISCEFWFRRVKNEFTTHERNFYSADRWRYGCSHIGGLPNKSKESRALLVCQFIFINSSMLFCVYNFTYSITYKTYHSNIRIHLPIVYMTGTEMPHHQTWDRGRACDKQSKPRISTNILQRNNFCKFWRSNTCFVFKQLCANGWPIWNSIQTS